METETAFDMVSEKDFQLDFSGRCMSREGRIKILAHESPSGSFREGQCGETECLGMCRRRTEAAGSRVWCSGVCLWALAVKTVRQDLYSGVNLRNHLENARGQLGLVLEGGLILRHLDWGLSL